MSKFYKWIIVYILILTMTACGGASVDDTSSEADLSEEVQEEHSPATEPDQEFRPALLCEDPAPVGIGLGESIEEAIEDPVWTKCYWIDVPEGLNKLEIELSGLEADLNLSVGYGFLVTLQYSMAEFWRIGESGTSNELFSIDNPTPGPYFIKVGIAGPKDPSPFTIEIKTDPVLDTPAPNSLPELDSCAFPAVEVTHNSVTQSELAESSRDPLPRSYFCLEVPDGLTSLEIVLSGLEADLVLFVRHQNPAEWMDISRGGSERTITIENPPAGSYFIDVVGAYPGAGSSFSLNITSQ